MSLYLNECRCSISSDVFVTPLVVFNLVGLGHLAQLLARELQQKRVGHHPDGREAHEPTRDAGREREAGEGQERARGDWDADGVSDWDGTSSSLTTTMSIGVGTATVYGDGTWTLIVQDLDPIIDGTLNSWSLTLTCY